MSTLGDKISEQIKKRRDGESTSKPVGSWDRLKTLLGYPKPEEEEDEDKASTPSQVTGSH